jgi:hypothetical protein
VLIFDKNEPARAGKRCVRSGASGEGRVHQLIDPNFNLRTGALDAPRSDKPVSDLRSRMIADMTIRRFSEKTQRDYIQQIAAFAGFLGCLRGTATGIDIRRFDPTTASIPRLTPPHPRSIFNLAVASRARARGKGGTHLHLSRSAQ